MLFGALALVRNVDTATQLLGNLGFKQDATATTDRVTQQAVAWLNTNSLALNVDVNGEGYYASNQEFAADGTTAQDPIDVTGRQLAATIHRQLIDWDSNNCAAATAGTYSSCTIRPKVVTDPINGNTATYVILRMCSKPGDKKVDSTVACAKPLYSTTNSANGRGEQSYASREIDGSNSDIYFRILVRVNGFRNTTSVTETIVHL